MGKKRGKSYQAVGVDPTKHYSMEEAFRLVTDKKVAKFDESIDLSVHLGVDTKQSNQQVRGAVELPHGLGKSVRVIVFAKGEKEKEALEAKADHVGSEDLVKKIKDGWFDFDRVVATPDQMSTVSKIASILGPRGKMPNPKLGTVTTDVGKAVEKEKKGKVSFKAIQSAKNGLIHSSIGRRSLGCEKLKENYMAFMQSVVKAKPASSKGTYLKSISLSSTMGPGIFLNVHEIG